jgi:hypothetical protein
MKRRRKRELLVLRQSRGVRARFIEIAAMLNKIGAKGAHGGVFLPCVAVWHNDRDRHAITLRREGDALPVIAARCGNQAGAIRHSVTQVCR